MNKSEMQEAMRNGKKVTHTYFLPDEFIKMNDSNELVDENGYILNSLSFWLHRSTPEWIYSGWSVYNN